MHQSDQRKPDNYQNLSLMQYKIHTTESAMHLVDITYISAKKNDYTKDN